MNYWPFAGLPLALGCSWLLRLLHKPGRLRILRLVEEQLPRSNILERLGENDPGLEDILRHTPASFRWLFLGFPANRLADRTKLVARNLDWYLRPPVYWFSPRWISPLLVYAILLGMVTCGTVGAALGVTAAFNGGWFFVALLALTPLECESDVDLSAFFADALLAQLKRRFDERLAEPVPVQPVLSDAAESQAGKSPSISAVTLARASQAD